MRQPQFAPYSSRALIRGRGFTLIELIAILVILATVSMTSIAALRSSHQNKQMVGVRMLVRDISYARERALATGVINWVEVDLFNDQVSYSAGNAWAGRVALTDMASNRLTRTNLDQSSDASFFRRVEIGALNGSSSSGAFGFDWLGRPVSTANAVLTAQQTLTVTVPGYSTVTVRVDAQSGRVWY